MHRSCGNGTWVLRDGTQGLWRCHMRGWGNGTQGQGGSVQGTEMVTQGLKRCLIGQSTNHLGMRTGMWIS